MKQHAVINKQLSAAQLNRLIAELKSTPLLQVLSPLRGLTSRWDAVSAVCVRAMADEIALMRQKAAELEAQVKRRELLEKVGQVPSHSNTQISIYL